MRDQLDIDRTAFNRFESEPLIPSPPPQLSSRVRQRSNCCHQCWSFFRRCSRWTCILFVLMVLIVLLVLLRSLLPFGWPSWFPNIFYSSSDPHIFVIVADDIGWSDLGYSGAEYSTPAIDSLRDNGIDLNRFYIHRSGTATRASLLSGRYAYEVGLQKGIATGSPAHLPTALQTLPELLRSERGYATHLIGKWNLGYSKWSYTPTERGFDTFLGFHQQSIDYWLYSAFANIDDTHYLGYDLWKNKEVYNSGLYTYATNLFMDHLSETVEHHLSSAPKDQPMFVLYAPPNAHTPLSYKHQYASQCAAAQPLRLRFDYCNLVQELDVSIDKLVTTLQENDVWDRSLIIYLSDNGGLSCYNIGDDGSCSGSVNAPLRAGKDTLFDGALRVRSFISGGFLPDSKRGTTTETLITSADLFPTIAAAANANEAMSTVSAHAVNWWNLLTADDDEELQEAQEDVVAQLSEGIGGSGSDDILDLDTVIFGTDQMNRPAAVVTELEFDLSKQYILQAVVFYHNYKFIISPLPAYDGYFSTPTDVESVSDQALGAEVVVGSKQQQKELTDLAIVEDRLESETAIQAITDYENFVIDNNIREYLFDIYSDPFETTNLVVEDEMHPLLVHLREILSDIATSERYSQPQKDTVPAESDPSLYNNVWYPYQNANAQN